ncbi:ribose/xylose/arabinose/galactoside ABC-type transport system permease subunit [Actinoplanes lutulentus]|uniref:Ribose ABC transporter membrane protein n=1 Tax=Actinoplanes lutulentus TaxID=1287878 RepID=A0A327ZNJ3_9ACTN|nr:ABC transporter permease [Actinoplanes lutulentus]MBB2943943.1 ribose/xylose/arabinose/galactoside ABC-type transport system permease subunit [Actinoplanes lutulentus]RAK42824.1 ribose ABC transporter membrane protein [Actinoplanes lutulentus]
MSAVATLTRPVRVGKIPHAGLLLVLVGIIVFASVRTDSFLNTNNLLNVARQVSVVAVIAAGLTLLMVAGGMDFSMGGNVAVTTAVAAQMLSHGYATWLTLVTAIGLSIAVGLVNGAVVTFTNVAPFVATLATATLLDGVALLVINGMSISIDEHLSGLGSGTTFGLPNLVFVAAAVLAVVAFVMRYTSFGRDAFAIGGNEDVARLSGITVSRDKLVLYGLAGALSGLAGIMLLSRLAASSPGTGGLQLQLTAVAAVVIGGTSLAGGKGTIGGTILGVLLLGVVANVLNLLQISSYYQQISVGAVLLIAAIANLLQSSRKR